MLLLQVLLEGTPSYTFAPCALCKAAQVGATCQAGLHNA